MNKDNMIGFGLILLVLIAFSWYNQPSAEQVEAQRTQDSIAAVLKENAQKQEEPILPEACCEARSAFLKTGSSPRVLHIRHQGVP